MNRGKIKKPNEFGPNSFGPNKFGVNKFAKQSFTKQNFWLKYKNNLPNKNNNKTSNLTFIAIIVFCLLVLWIITGFYYLDTNELGVITREGRVVETVKGLKVGLMAPFPFANIHIIDASISNSISLGELGLNETNYSLLSKDLQKIIISGSFAYQVVEPQLLYKSIFQDQKQLDKAIKGIVEQRLHQYIATKTQDELLNINLIVIANELRDGLNRDLSAYGIKIAKLNITALHNYQQELLTKDTPVASSAGEAMPDKSSTGDTLIASKLLAEANAYRQNQIAITRVNIDKFNQLLGLYQQSPYSIVQQMYYDTLATVPESSAANEYHLLNLNLSELLDLAKQAVTSGSAVVTESTGRDDKREVNRSRNFDRS